MKANNLSIGIPNKGCDKDCPYCVSKMTPGVEKNTELFRFNMSKARKLADTANVSSVSLTGKGEPALNMADVYFTLGEFSDYITELQTNGLWLSQSLDFIDQLAIRGLNVIAISIDNIEDFRRMEEVAKKAWRVGIIPRATVNITNFISPDVTLMNFIDLCKVTGFKQLSFRNIVKPTNCVENKITKWIDENVTFNHYYLLTQQIKDNKDKKFIRDLNYGARLYDLDGISLTSFDYCIQDSSNGDDIRSLIYQQDGHCYTSWGSRASIIF